VRGAVGEEDAEHPVVRILMVENFGDPRPQCLGDKKAVELEEEEFVVVLCSRDVVVVDDCREDGGHGAFC
jgi:hypothetical protein